MDSPAKASGVAIWAGLIAIYIVWGSTYLAILFAALLVDHYVPPFGL